MNGFFHTHSVDQRDNKIHDVRSGRPGAEMISQTFEEMIGVVFTQGVARIEPEATGARATLSIDKRARGIRGPVAAVAGGAE